MNKKFTILIFWSWVLSTSVSAQELDITQYLTAMMKCNAEQYDPGLDDFDIDGFNAAWKACAPAREALLQALPEEMRPEWEAKLEMMRTSVIDRFQPQPSASGYGLNPDNPVKIGGIEKGPQRTYAYFARLRTSEGQPVSARRIGSCCRFKTPNAQIGDHAALDKYELTSEGSRSTTIVYVNIYDEDDVQAIKGFALNDDA